MHLELIDYIDLLKKAENKGKNRRLLCQYLREHGYKFVTRKDLERTPLKLKKSHKKYDFMVLMHPRGMDTFLSFGVVMYGKLTNEVVIYLNYHYYDTFDLELGQEKHNFKKLKQFMVFPKAMHYDERKTWRSENEKVKKNPQFVTSKFYNKWKPLITIKIKK